MRQLRSVVSAVFPAFSPLEADSRPSVFASKPTRFRHLCGEFWIRSGRLAVRPAPLEPALCSHCPSFRAAGFSKEGKLPPLKLPFPVSLLTARMIPSS